MKLQGVKREVTFYSKSGTSVKVMNIHKQLSRGVPTKRCSENMQQIFRRTPMPKCGFNKVVLQSNFIEITLEHGYSFSLYLSAG